MAIRTRIDSTTGAVSTNNLSGMLVGKDASNRGMLPFPDDSVVTQSATGQLTLAHCGLNVVSGTSAVTLTMPLAATSAGALFTFRLGSADAHVLTASLETAGTKRFTDGTSIGSKITFAAAAGNSVALMCDGVNFLVMGRSGSLTFA